RPDDSPVSCATSGLDPLIVGYGFSFAVVAARQGHYIGPGAGFRLFANPVGFQYFVAHRIARHVKVFAAACGVYPEFPVYAARVIAEKQILSPLFVATGVGIRRAHDMRLALGVKLFFFPVFATPGAPDMQHLASSSSV